MLEQHEMHPVATYESGAEEWLCSECGRRVRFQLVPFQRTVLIQGDNQIRHWGGGVTATSPEITAPASPILAKPYRIH